MILPGFPVLLPAPASSSSGFPAVTINRADIGGAGTTYGYIRSGGTVSTMFGGLSGGTLSATLVPGFVTDAVVSTSESFLITIYIIGDCASLLSGVTALMDSGTPLPLLAPFEYFPDLDVTGAQFSGGWTSTGNRTIQLV